ncbi:MAG: hypothetical protein K5893_01505 [Prevotella sp.]|nr:hypothetical protein [Prevotella sp.]
MPKSNNRPLARFVGMLFVLFIWTTCVPMLLSCQSDEEELEPVPYQKLEAIVSEQDIVFNDVIKILQREAGTIENVLGKENIDTGDGLMEQYSDMLDMAALRARKYKAYTINYHTTDPNGKPIIASGVVYYPKTGSPKGVIEALSTNKDKKLCPSKETVSFEMLVGMTGYIVLVADQIGFGTSESMVIPYLYYDNVAKVCADLRVAATELVRNKYGRSMPSFTLLTGLSLAATQAWSLARYYHLHPELGVGVNQIWICGGPYNSLNVLEHQLQTLYTDYSFMPNALYSLNHYENLGLDLREVFKGELSQHYEEWCTGDIPIYDLTDYLGTDLSEYLNLDFFNDTNPDFLKVKQALKKNDVPNDWVPSCPVHIYHGRKDTYVPLSSSEELVAYLKSVGANVDFVVTETGHVENCIAMESELLKILYK